MPRNKSLFSQLVICSRCKKHMKKKSERGVSKYCCSSYDNYKTCERLIIEEDYIQSLLFRKFDKYLNREEIVELVKEVIVYSRSIGKDGRGNKIVKYRLDINFHNGEQIIEDDKYLQYL